MNNLVLILLASVFSFDYLAVQGLAPSAVTLFPELLSAVATILVVGRLASDKRFDLSVKYLIFFGFFALLIICGWILNDTPSGAILAGCRVYFKYLPFFFLPIVYPFTARQLKLQLGFLSGIMVLQLPIAVAQRIVFADYGTGDVVRGSLPTGSFMSMVLVSALAIVLSFYLKGQLSKLKFAVFSVVLVLPTTINETKGTLLLLPIAILIPLLVSGTVKRIGSLVAVLGVAAVAVGLFVSLYSYTQTNLGRSNTSVVEFFTDPQKVFRYVAPQTAGIKTADDRQGRLDQPLTAIQDLSDDPLKLLLGLGVGNTTPSPIASLQGDYVSLHRDGFVSTTGPYVIYETGLIGVAFWFFFFWMVHRDSRRLARQDGMVGALALGWSGVVLVLAASVLYKNWVAVNGIMYPFWYFTGLIAATLARNAATESSGHHRAAFRSTVVTTPMARTFNER